MIEKRAAPPKGVQRFERKLGRAVAVGDDRRVDLSFSSEQPVARWFGNEVLSHAPGAADLSRIGSGDAPLLWNHDINAVISTVESARIAGGQGRAVVRFANTPEAQRVVDLINDGIVRSVSFSL